MSKFIVSLFLATAGSFLLTRALNIESVIDALMLNVGIVLIAYVAVLNRPKP